MGKARPGGGRPPGRRGGGGTGPSKGGGGGTTGHRSKGVKASSSVHDGVRVLVVGLAALAVLFVGVPFAYVAWGLVTGT